MTDTTPIIAYVISDSLGQSAVSVTRATLSKFKDIRIRIKDYTFITEFSKIDSVIEDVEKEDDRVLIFHAFSNSKMADYLEDTLKNTKYSCVDVLTPIVNRVAEATGFQSEKEYTVTKLDDLYFDRIGALEFAVAHDDGKEPKGFLEADILILGISRTSKTPLSIYLANNNYKVANLPLMPESELPDELWEVDPKRIIGLTNNIDVLSEIRKERMISYGLNPDTIYSDRERIKKEIDYAIELYEKLNCKIINVANKSIEETASLIIGHLTEEGLFHVPQ